LPISADQPALDRDFTYKNTIKIFGRFICCKKTKEKSPDMTGKLKILRETLTEIINTHREEDGAVFEVNMAGWFNNADGKMYMTLELSPRYRPAVQRSKKGMTVEDFFNEIADE
jgi:hypothetical protein